MRFNQFSYLALPRDTIIFELKKYGFDLPVNITNKQMLEAFLIRFFFNFKNSSYPLSSLAVDKETDLLTFFYIQPLNTFLPKFLIEVYSESSSAIA